MRHKREAAQALAQRALYATDALKEEGGDEYLRAEEEADEIDKRLRHLSKRVHEEYTDPVAQRVVALWDEADDLVRQFSVLPPVLMPTPSNLCSMAHLAIQASSARPTRPADRLADLLLVHQSTTVRLAGCQRQAPFCSPIPLCVRSVSRQATGAGSLPGTPLAYLRFKQTS